MGRKIHYSSNLLGHAATSERQSDSPSLSRDPCTWSILWWVALLCLSDISSTILAKNVGAISKLNTKYLRPPMQCYHVAVFMYSPNDFSSYRHCLGERGGGGGRLRIRNDRTTKLVATGYKCPKHNCTLQRLFRICPIKYCPNCRWSLLVRARNATRGPRTWTSGNGIFLVCSVCYF